MLSCLKSFVLMLCLAAAHPLDAGVGFERIRTADSTEVGVWYPARGRTEPLQLGLYSHEAMLGGAPEGRRLPLVVISHGNGGHFAGHHDTATALARAGFVVAALTHRADNWRDQSGATQVEARPVALSSLITHMLERWRHRRTIDGRRIGAFGFSAGAFTVLAAAGARPDLRRVAAHCAANPDFHDCRLLRANPRPAIAWPNVEDRRILAVVAAAPALGFSFDRSTMRTVDVPVQLWRAADDAVLPAPLYAEAVRDALPRRPEFRVVTGAGHFDFLAPCSATGDLAGICTSAPGFDRAAFHTQFNAEVVRFFRKNLARSAAARRSE